MTTLFGHDSLPMSVTPHQARLWMATNPVRPAARASSRMAAAMTGGQWNPDPADPIRLDTLGILRGGHKRLEAVVKANLTVPMFVQMPAPPLPHEIVPAAYTAHDGTGVHAIRFDGTNHPTITTWVADDTEDAWITHLAADRMIIFHAGPQKRGQLMCPGDWLVRDRRYWTYTHTLFGDTFTYQVPPTWATPVWSNT